MNTAAVCVSACWKYDCVVACGFWSTKVHVVFQFAEPSWNISPGKPASCSSLARLLAAAMFCVSYMFSHAGPSLQSWSSTWPQDKYSFADVTRRQVWSARLGHERSRPRGGCWGQHRHAAATHRSADRQLDIVLPLFAGLLATSVSHHVTCRPDVDCVWHRYYGSCVFCVSWMFIRPPDIVARDMLSGFPDSHTYTVSQKKPDPYYVLK